MERVAIRNVEPDDGDGTARRSLTGPLGATDIACNHYRIPPGEGFPGGLHTHLDQEEVFVVLEGEAAFEWYGRNEGSRSGSADWLADAGPGEEFAVGAGEAVRFAPGEFHSGRNGADRDLVALALGAPPESADVRIPVPCPACDHPALRPEAGRDGLTLACPDCGAAHVPAPCPDCGGERLEAALGDDGRPVVVCDGCAAEFDRPPVAGSE